ncbi:hypothetical protein AAE478_002086 [Parahypoxylon ruwenzoriense]
MRKLSLEKACEHFSKVVDVEIPTIKSDIDQLLKALTINRRLIQLAHELKASKHDLKFYIMSNTSHEQFEVVRNMDLPWPLFDSIFISAAAGMRKPDLCFFEYVIDSIGVDPSQVVMIDDGPENICAARSPSSRL